MASSETAAGARDPLLTMTGLRIEGQAEDEWHEIVHGVDVVLHRGEVLGLIGESGAGKSTIGLAAMGFARPGCRLTGGDIVFDGVELRGASQDHKRRLRGARIAYVAQSAAAAFNPAHRLIDQFAEAPVRHRVKSRAEAESDAKDLYGRLRLPEPETIGYRYPHQVSGGQLQRAMVAMAMACRPDLIVFDEPTTALDVTTQIEVLAAIKDVVRQFDTAAIYISHDLAVVAQMADRIMVLRHGNLVEEGTADRIVNRPAQEYTQNLLAVRSYRKPTAEPAREEPLLRIEGCPRAIADPRVCWKASIWKSAGSAPSRSWASREAARARSRGSSPACCRRRKAGSSSTARCWRRRSRGGRAHSFAGCR